MNDVVLTGFMGTGKSTVGRTLADRYGLCFVDTDEEIVRRAGTPIPGIFETVGEAGFRRLETEVLRDLRNGSGRVIATGGGALLDVANRALVGPDRLILCLTCGTDELEQRLNGGAERPLLAGNWLGLLESRQSGYDAFEQIDTSGRTPDEVAGEIATRTGLDRLGELQFRPSQRSTINFGRGASGQLGTWLGGEPHLGSVLLVTDACVDRLGIPERVRYGLGAAGRHVRVVVLPAGEETKSVAVLDRLYGECLAAGMDRGGLIVGIGGGVIGDLAGMLAATYMRGIRLVLVPTTLLAQVDAAIGGKVGVDAAGTKNLAGAFHPASEVVIDPDLLETLPSARLSEGLAEIIKIALMRAPLLLERLLQLQAREDILQNPDIVRQAASEKIAVVAADPFEQGERALLNYGHTVGHGIEAASGYHVSHGEAVAVGMAAEADIGEALAVTERGTRDLVISLNERFQLPVTIPGIDADSAFKAMLGDKKRRGGILHMAIPRAPGTGTVVSVDDDLARAGLVSVLVAAS